MLWNSDVLDSELTDYSITRYFKINGRSVNIKSVYNLFWLYINPDASCLMFMLLKLFIAMVCLLCFILCITYILLTVNMLSLSCCLMRCMLIINFLKGTNKPTYLHTYLPVLFSYGYIFTWFKKVHFKCIHASWSAVVQHKHITLLLLTQSFLLIWNLENINKKQVLPCTVHILIELHFWLIREHVFHHIHASFQ